MITELLKFVEVLIQKNPRDTYPDMPTNRKKNLSTILKMLVRYQKLVQN